MTAERMRALKQLLEEHRPQPEQPPNMLRTLLAVQQALGHVPEDAFPAIAEALGVTEANVAGVLSYYPDLRRSPGGRHVIRLCLGEACVANRSSQLLPGLVRESNTELGGTSRDGRFTLERVYCLGNCGVGPTVMVDDHIYGRLTPADLPGLLARYP